MLARARSREAQFGAPLVRQPNPGSLGYGDHRRMLELAIQRNCIKPLTNISHAAEGFYLVLSLNLAADHRRCDKEAETSRSEHRQQSAVLKLRNDHRPDLFRIEPLIQGTAHRRIL